MTRTVDPTSATSPAMAAEMPAAPPIGPLSAQPAGSTGKTGSSEGRFTRDAAQPGRDRGTPASVLLHDLQLKTGAKPEAGSEGEGQRTGASERGSSSDGGSTGSHAHTATADLQAVVTPASASAPAIASPNAGSGTFPGNSPALTGSDRHGARAGGSSGESAGPASVPDAGDAGQPAPTSINTARVLRSMQGSEMRVGMHSVEFGSLSINTSVTHGAVAAQISFEHAELGRALAAHLPAMEARLSRDSGMEARVEVRQGGSSSMDASGGQGRADGQRQGQSRSNHASALPGSVVAGSTEMRPLSSEPHAAGAGSGRLDIRI